MPLIVIIGASDVGRRTCALLEQEGQSTIHLAEPSDGELKSVLKGDVAGVAVLLHDDIRAMRFCMTVEHLVPGVRIFVAIFDGTAREQLVKAVPNCVVLSPAAIAVPSIVASVLAPQCLAIARARESEGSRWHRIETDTPSTPAIVVSRVSVRPFEVSRSLRLKATAGIARGQLRPYDTGTRVLLFGALGLLTVILIDAVLASTRTTWADALYEAARTTATISAPDTPDDAPHLLWATVAAIMAMAFTATFGAGIVHHLISGRHAGLLGRKVVPRSGHVVIAGMGQVGLRLAQELRAMGVGVVGIDPHAGAAGMDIAREQGLPVVIADATTRRGLERVALRRALALVAACSEDRDSIAIAVSAAAVAPSTPVVMRAGADEAIEQTRALWGIAPVIDVNALTATYVVQSILRQEPMVVAANGSSVLAIVDASGHYVDALPSGTARCACA